MPWLMAGLLAGAVLLMQATHVHGLRAYATKISASTMLRAIHRKALPDETLYIFDGTAMIYQVRQNLPHLDASLPLSAGALSAMAMAFARFVREMKPTYLAVAYDSSKKTFRTEMLPSYKQQRPRAPEDLTAQLHIAPRLMETFGCATLRAEGFEADDVMASLGCWARDRGMHVVHVSIDKDMLQLVRQGVHVMHPFTMRVSGAAEVLEKHGVTPEAFPDYQALMGDAVDNIPGAMGIGSRTATALIQHFGSVDGLVQKLGVPASWTPPADVLPSGGGRLKLQVAREVVALFAAAYGQDMVDAALSELKTCLATADVSLNAYSALASLLLCGADNLCTYRDIARLRTDLSVAELLGASEVSSETFRFTGERRGAADEVQGEVEAFSSALREPLSLLRQQYHRMER